MITIKDPQLERREFKKLFKSNDICLKLRPYNDGKVDIILSASEYNKTTTYTIQADMTPQYSLKNNITLTGVEPIDCVWDVIFSKDGFYVDTYEVAYSDLITKSKSGTEGWISQVIFKSRTKKRDFIAPCNWAWKMIS